VEEGTRFTDKKRERTRRSSSSSPFRWSVKPLPPQEPLHMTVTHHYILTGSRQASIDK
jgi:hypothetical protein